MIVFFIKYIRVFGNNNFTLLLADLIHNPCEDRLFEIVKCSILFH